MLPQYFFWLRILASPGMFFDPLDSATRRYVMCLTDHTVRWSAGTKEHCMDASCVHNSSSMYKLGFCPSIFYSAELPVDFEILSAPTAIPLYFAMTHRAQGAIQLSSASILSAIYYCTELPVKGAGTILGSS